MQGGITFGHIEAQGWSPNPGRYVGVASGEDVSDEDFKEQLETLNEELEFAERSGAGPGADHRRECGGSVGGVTSVTRFSTLTIEEVGT